MKARILTSIIISILFVLMTYQLASAAWPVDPTVNVPICTDAAYQILGPVVSDGSGGMIVVWGDGRQSPRDIYAQRVDADGNVLWTMDGLGICTDAGNQGHPSAASDGFGGAIIVWNDVRNGNYDIYAQRVNANGNVLWGTNDKVICDASGDQMEADIVGDGSGGAIITWQDTRSGGSSPCIYAQYVDANGDKQWDTNDVLICTNSTARKNPKAVSDGSGGAIIAWIDYRNGAWDVYAQRVDSNGSIHTGWASDGVAVATGSGDQTIGSIVSDGTNGAFIMWNSTVGTAGNARRIASDGSLPWATVSLGNGSIYSAVSDGSGGAITTWGSGGTVYAERLDSSGSKLWSSIAVGGGGNTRPNITNTAGGVIIAWQDSSLDIYAQNLDLSGNEQWASDVAISTATGEQGYPKSVSDGSGGAVIAWSDKRSDANGDIYAQRVYSDGSLSCVETFPAGDPVGDGNCLSFDGVDDYVSTADIDLSGDFTLMAWFNSDNVNAQLQPILSKQSGASNHNETAEFNLQVQPDGNLNFFMSSETEYDIQIDGGILSPNTWYQVAIVMSSNTATMYLNGTSKGSDTYEGTRRNGTENMSIGWYYNGVHQYWLGKIDEVRAWNVARTEQEIRLNMYNTLTGSESGLVGYWKLDDGCGTTAMDTAGSNDGTLYDVNPGNGDGDTPPVWVVSTVPTCVPSTFPAGDPVGEGICLDFDGVDDYVDAGNSINLANQSFSLAAWVKRERNGVYEWLTCQGQSTPNLGLHFGFRETNVFTFAFHSNDLDTPASYADTDWHYWVGTYDANTGARKIYRDGQVVASDTATANYQGTGNLRIGTRYDLDGGFFQGQIDEVRVRDVVLTGQQIRLNMYDTLSGSEPGLIGYWKLDEGCGTTATDTAGGDDNGALTNGPVWVASTVPTPENNLKLVLGNQTIGVVPGPTNSADADLVYEGVNFKGCEIEISYSAAINFVSVSGETNFQAYASGNTISVAYMGAGSINIPDKIATLTFGGLVEGEGNIAIAVSEVRGLTEDGDSQITLSHTAEVTGYINVDGSAPTVDWVLIQSNDPGRVNPDLFDYIKNDDTVTVTASGADQPAVAWAAGVAASGVTANLSGFGGGAAVAPTTFNYDSGTRQWDASWVLSPAACNPADGVVNVTVSATDVVGNGPTTGQDDGTAPGDTAGLVGIIADNTPPDAVSSLTAAVDAIAGPPPENRVKLEFSFSGTWGDTADYIGIRFSRKSASQIVNSLGYPRYDADDGIAPPEYPVANGYETGKTCNHDDYYATGPTDANAAHINSTYASGPGDPVIYLDNDVALGQDVYYYQSYVYDKVGNYSAADTANHNDRNSATGYFLGDFDNDSNVDFDDLTPFSNAFGTDYNDAGWDTSDDCDIGPTGATQTRGADNRFGLPTTDGACDFEDLMIFAMNYDNVPPAPMYQPPVFPEDTPLVALSSEQGTVDGGGMFSVELKLSHKLKAKGARLMLNYDTRCFSVVKVTEGDLGLTFFSAKDKGGVVDINVAALGSDVPLADETIATVEFRAVGSSSNTNIYLSKVDVRGVRNERTDEKLAELGKIGLSLSVGKPGVTKVFHNYPNPFNPETWIPFQLDQDTDVTVKIYNLSGHLVKTIELGNQPAGYYLSREQAIHWDGRNNSGEKVSSGIYFYHFQAGKVIKTSKMAILK